jgi:Stage II sporulation protein E (SpoIIE)
MLICMHLESLLNARSGAHSLFVRRMPLALFLCISMSVAWLVAPRAVAASEQGSPATSPVKIDALGKGSVALDGPWQFHLGDNPAWASPAIDDATGHDGWEQITADATWGTQTHPSYTGYAWYRRHIDLTVAPGASPDIALLIPAVDDLYEFYWNGQPMGHLGSFLPRPDFLAAVPAQTYGLGPIRRGVLAVRVFKVPLASNDDGTAGGFEGAPILGSPAAIASAKDALDYHWLRAQQFRFALTGLYTLASLLSLIIWLRDRRQWLLFWMMVYTFMPALELLLNGLRLPVSSILLTFLMQALIQLREVSQWFLLLWLLQLHENFNLRRAIRVIAIFSMICGAADGSLGFFYTFLGERTFQVTDAILTFFILPGEIIPAFLVVYAVVRRKQLDFARWFVASMALVNGVFYSVSNIAAQGIRFTHWTLAPNMTAPHLTLFGSVLPIQTILRTVLFLSILYAVIRYAIDHRSRQTALELELENARELQRVLVPEALPAIPGFNLTSAYRPDREVGGDFFQIIALEGNSTLIVLGDVSGKGLRAAMAVSLIVGAIRTLAESTTSPAELLARLSRHLHGHLQGGFATCIAVRLDPGGVCTVASAGHPGPFLNGRELELPGALPVGLSPDASYLETRINLEAATHLALYTDGLLEARSPSGELYGFSRMQTLFSGNPTAAQATDAAVKFGQNDDITVLTLTRLATSEPSSSELSRPPILSPA